MTQYSDLEDLANSYNLTGNLSGTSSVPNITLSTDINGKNIITYTHFASYSDITSASYYDANDPEAQNIVDGDDYRDDIEDAIETILNPTSAFSVMFSDVAKIDFQEASSSTGIITFAQMEDSFPAFNSSPSTTAGTYMYDGASAYPSDYYGDIFINLDHDARPGIGNTGIGTNVWTVEGDVVAGTDAYTVLMEEISHALGVDIYQPGTATPKNASLDSNKYTVTSYNVHPDMYFEDDVILGITNGDDIYGPHPTGLQLYDIAALQAIYGREYTTRNTATTYTFGTDEAFGATKDDAFVYTIWDGGGTDEIVATGYDHRVQIDLRQGRFSSIGERGDGTAVALDNGSYDAGNVAIAYYTVIENAIGTAYDDILIGNAWNNSLIGGSGNDYLYGDGVVYRKALEGDWSFTTGMDDVGFLGEIKVDGAGNTVYYDPHRGWSDESGDSPIYADDFSGRDELYGGDGDDHLYGGAGFDILHGGGIMTF